MRYLLLQIPSIYLIHLIHSLQTACHEVLGREDTERQGISDTQAETQNEQLTYKSQ